MSKEVWLAQYERIYNEMPEGTSEDVMAEMATEATADQLARMADEARDRFKEGDK